MENLAAVTGVNVDATMYFARFVTFDLTTNGIEMPLFRQIQKNT